MRPRIFIAIHYLEIGGAERSLIGLLQALNPTIYDIDLFVYSHRGDLMHNIPQGVHLLPEIKEYALIEAPIKQVIQKGCFRMAYARLIAKLKYYFYKKRKGITEGSAIFQYIGNAVTPCLPSLDFYGQYDLAISFLVPHNIVRDKVVAQKKICWIHTDYSKIDVNVALELPIWKSYNYIVSISKDVTDKFCRKFPTLQNKIIEISNILSPLFIRRLASNVPFERINKEMQTEKGEIRLLSVGRFTKAKNYDNVPQICKTLLQKGVLVKWFLIGYGSDEALIRTKIKETGMEKHVLLLGKRTNPYPYIAHCDVYVQPSRFEGNAVTVREAQILCKPVVITHYPTAESQIIHNVDGVIVPQENAECASGIASFLKNKTLQKNIIKYLQEHDYGNESEIKKLETLINNPL